MTPSAETLAIAFGEKAPRSRLWRPPIGHCFSVFVDPAIEAFGAGDMVHHAMVAMIGLTGGDVGLEIGAKVLDEISIVLDGGRPGVGGVPGAYSGLCTPLVLDNVMVGAEIVLNDRYLRCPDGTWLSKGVLHEFGHAFGFGDVEFEQSIMGGLDHHATQPTDLDSKAWLWIRDQPAGALRPGLRPGAMSRSDAPRTIIDPPPGWIY